MKKILVGLSLTILVSTNAFADFSGEYVKKNGVVDIAQQGNQIKFAINSSVGMHACDVEGSAAMTDANSVVYKSGDSSQCVITLTFSGNKLKVKTKECDGSCGMSATGSMDGAYRKKK